MIEKMRGVARTLALMSVVISSLHAQGAGSAPVAEEFQGLHFRSIGPVTMSGRIADLAVYEAKPSIYYVGTAHGGVWKTVSNGTMFTPLLQDQGLLSIGDVAVSQANPDLVWVGTGEANNRQSTSWGDGIYKSSDGGKTFANMGLRDSKHIARIIIDPTNNDVVIVAAQGPLFGPGGERGVYKTMNGGQSWTQVLKVDDETGATDLAMSATDPKTLYAATYQRRRVACCMNGGGPGSGIWKSIDLGDHWTRLTGNGWPEGSLGRIGIDAYRKNGNIVYANVEGPGGGGRGAGGRGAAGAADTTGGRGAAPAPVATTGVYRSDDGGQSWRKVSGTNPRPMYFSQMRIDPNNADRIYMGGVGLHMSSDAGATFQQDAAESIHDDIHAIWIDPSNSDHLVIGGDGGLATSYDMARTWLALLNLPVGLFYHVGYDLETPYNVCGGMQDNYDWCGPSASRHSAGIYNFAWFQIQGGDGFVAIPDRRDSRIVYTESQDGNITRKNKITGESKGIRPSAANTAALAPGEVLRFHWDTPLIISPNDAGVLLVGTNRVMKSTDRGDSWVPISPDVTNNVNRDTVVTMGLKGSDVRIARDDGIGSYSTIVALAESPKLPGVYYTGTDDGVVSVARDGGKTWSNITSHIPGFPVGSFVSEVVPSKFDAATVYVTVDNHRLNDYATHMWVSNDYGATFRSLNANLSGEVVKTMTEDQRNADVLYIGTETGIFLSLDRGASWRRLKANLPTVRVDEITLHPRDNAMLVATHGRAIWILDHLEPIQEYTANAVATADAKLFSVPTALEWKSKDDQNDEFWGHQYWVGENPPTDALIQIYLKKPISDLKLRVTDGLGKQIRDLTVPANRNQAGIQTICWDLRLDPTGAAGAAGGGGGGGRAGRGGAAGGNLPPGAPTPQPVAGYLPMNPCGGAGGGGGGGGFGGGGGATGAGPHVMPGTYMVALVADGKTVDSKPMKVVFDPALNYTEQMGKRYFAVTADLHAMQRRAAAVATALSALYSQMTDIASKIDARADVPAAVKTQFATLNREFNAIRPKFGVPPQATGLVAGGRGGGGGRGGAANPADSANVVSKAALLKNQIQNVWEIPSEGLARQYTVLKLSLPKAIADANLLLTKVGPVGASLKKYDLTLTVPVVEK